MMFYMLLYYFLPFQRYVSFASLALMIAYAVCVVFFSLWTLVAEIEGKDDAGPAGTTATLTSLGFNSDGGSCDNTPPNGEGNFHWCVCTDTFYFSFYHTTEYSTNIMLL
tara:strand:- start:305 stop:631 length:327 start_codon:yes stop_codon:yes gene_type:complete